LCSQRMICHDIWIHLELWLAFLIVWYIFVFKKRRYTYTVFKRHASF